MKKALLSLALALTLLAAGLLGSYAAHSSASAPQQATIHMQSRTAFWYCPVYGSTSNKHGGTTCPSPVPAV